MKMRLITEKLIEEKLQMLKNIECFCLQYKHVDAVDYLDPEDMVDVSCKLDDLECQLENTYGSFMDLQSFVDDRTSIYRRQVEEQKAREAYGYDAQVWGDYYSGIGI